MSLNLFIVGPSGCGKSTQAKLIAEKYGLTHLSMGQILRDEIAAGTGFGLEAKSYVDQGVWAPDDLVFDMLIAKLKTLDFQNFIIDGFPRVLNQGKVIEFFLKKQNQPFSLLIHLDVTFEEIMTRRVKAGTEFQKEDTNRTDNTPEAVAARQKSYDDTIGNIKEYFKTKDKLFEVNGNRPIEPIFEDICNAIDKIK
jgi:adenylate kinase